MTGPVPPMPGQESNATTATATALGGVPEEDAAHPELATEECGERGRLFVKVMGVKDLDLPLPRSMYPLNPCSVILLLTRSRRTNVVQPDP